MDLTTTLDTNMPAGCGCPACQSGFTNSDPIGYNEESGGGATGAPTVYGTAEQMADQLVNGYWESVGWEAHQWGTSTVSYSLSNEYTAAEKDSFRMSFDMWSDVADITFQEVSSGAQITIVEGDDGKAWSGSGTWDPSTTNLLSNTISIDTDAWSNLVGIGGYGVQTILHEIGHSLGLGHAGNYNGSVNYNQDVVYLNDNRQHSLMSYNNANLLGTDHWSGSGQWQYGATPLLYDVMAIQQIYGANYATRAGDTTYGFNSNTGRAQYDLSVNSAPFAIWDGGGSDTLDLSGYSTDQVITLVEGEFTSAGDMTNNIVIAYGTVIENAVGGSGNDQIFGNDANNLLLGGSGNDALFGSLGNDTLDGQDGTDTVEYSYTVDSFAFNFIDNITVALTHLAQSFTDMLSNIENFIFNGIAYTFAELEESFGALDVIGVRLYWTGGEYVYNSEINETKTVTAAEMGFGGSSGDQITIDRAFYDITVTVNDINAADDLRLYGSEQDETFTVNGTHNSMSVIVKAGAGDDTIVIAVTGNDRLYGEDGNDNIDAGAGDDKLYGGDGIDTLTAGLGNDMAYGGLGDDILNGGDGDDRLYGEAGADQLNGDDGRDKLYGGDGDDTLNGGIDNDRLYGEDGIDVLNGGDGHDFLYGGADNDTLNGDANNDKLFGEDGDDLLNGGDGKDILTGGLGNDELNGGNSADQLNGNEGADTLNGDGGVDELNGGDGDDILNGGDGNDKLYGDADNDQLDGGADNDRLEGGTGTDTLLGGTGDDTLLGQEDNDRLEGGADNDTLYGGDGLDLLIGGAGIDALFGQAGSDTFGFTSMDGSNDTIKDFTLSGGDADKINITDLLSGFTQGVDDINDFVRLSFKSTDRTDLQIDADGGGDTYVTVAAIRGSDFTGTTLDDLVSSGQLITDTSLL